MLLACLTDAIRFAVSLSCTALCIRKGNMGGALSHEAQNYINLELRVVIYLIFLGKQKSHLPRKKILPSYVF